jgi:radical SAM protein with 4Fe4S-binding SPASM domain
MELGGAPSDTEIDSASRCKSKAFCRAAFENLHISIGGVAKPCCEFEGIIGDVKKSSIEEIWNSQELDDLRAKMRRDERDERCRKCYNFEDAGAGSLRHMFNGSNSAAPSPKFEASERPKFLDLRFSNLCNLGCRTCTPDASTKWYADAKKLKLWNVGSNALVETFESKLAAQDSLSPTLRTVEGVYFAGGEPLLHEGHYAVLQELIALGRTDVALWYNSNLTELRLGKQEVLPLWSQFKRVLLAASIDGHKERGELIRHGLSWERFAENIKIVRQECPHVEMVFAITVSIFNVMTLPALCLSLMEIDKGRQTRFSFNILQEPEHYSSQILPLHMKQKAKQNIESFAEEFGFSEELSPLVNFMMFEDKSRRLRSFRTISLRIDEIRNQSIVETLPELSSLFEENYFRRQFRKTTQSLDGFVASLRHRQGG